MKLEAFAKYYNPQGTGNLTGFAAALTTAFGLSAASTGEAALAYQTLNTYGGVVAGGGGNGNSSYPKAFVTILLFDKDYKLVDFTFDQINGGQQVGVSPKAAHDAMMCEYTVKEAGYAYMYISNENPTMVEVYFDDIAVTYTPSNLIQGNEYYPFGMQTANSWTRDGNKNDYLYNQGTELNATSGWYETFFRGYDPTLGKFLQVDPMTDKYASWTPYNYGFNSPGVFNDPLGDDAGSSVRDGYSYASMGGCGCWQDKDPQDAHAGADGGMFGSSWNMLTYGSATIGGSAFPRWGVSNVQYPTASGNFSHASQPTAFQRALRYALKHPGSVVMAADQNGWQVSRPDLSMKIFEEGPEQDHASLHPTADGSPYLRLIRDTYVRHELRGEPIRSLEMGFPNGARIVYVVYRAVARDGRVYWGMTRNFIQRVRGHGKRFQNINDDYKDIPSLKAARGLEQLQIDKSGGVRALDNKINSISSKNPELMEYYREAIRYLIEIGKQ